MELKSIMEGVKYHSKLSSNRTFMELKFNSYLGLMRHCKF